MLRFTLKAPGEMVRDEATEPVLKDNEVLIEVASVGICGADVISYNGRNLSLTPLPLVPGHEFGGTVKEIKGDTKKLKAGDKVAVFPLMSCGSCYYCSQGLEIDCGSLNYYGSPSLEGACVERIAVPIDKCIKLSDDFDMRYSAIIEPVTVAYHAIGTIKDSVLLINGVGTIGMLMVEIAKAHNNTVIAVDIDDNMLNIAQKLGADLTVNFNDAEKDKKIEAFLKDDKVDAAALTFVNESVYDWILDTVRKHGLVVSIAETDAIFGFKYIKHVFKALTLRGSVGYFYKEFEEAARMVQEGLINYKDIVTRFFPMLQADEAFEYRAKNNVLKVVLIR